MKVVKVLKEKLTIWRFKRNWRKKNTHNTTSVGNLFKIDSVEVGNHTYGKIHCLNWGDAGEKLIIGNFCSIAQEVMFILNADHDPALLSTFPFKVKMHLNGNGLEGISKGNITVGDDVWIGYRSTILSGVQIGQGAIVAAGSVVTKDVPPYAIVGGVPAKVIKYRFPQEVIDKLVKADYSRLTSEKISKNLNEMYLPLTADNVDNLLRILDISSEE